MELKGKTAIVTGAASGIGRSTARKLAQAGAYVLLGDIAEDGGRAAAADIRADGFEADFIRLDVTDLDAVATFRAEAYKRSPHVDIVANVAAGARSSRSWRTRRTSGARWST